MKKNELLKKIAIDTDMSIKDVNKVLNSFVEVTREALSDNDKITLRNLGTFSTKKRASRVATLNGEKYLIKERIAPVFVFSDNTTKLFKK